MKRIHLFLLLFSFLAFSCNTGTNDSEQENDLDTLAAEVDSLSGDYELVWSDEFEYEGFPDSTKWSYDIGGHGWGNHELQYYTEKREKNARVENGKLIIEAHKEDFEGMNYTSARLVTKNKGDWTYGKFVIRAKLPSGKGTWGAIWMLPTEWDLGNKNWPDVGEIDIMEYVGHAKDTVLGTIHCNQFNGMKHTQVGKSIVVKGAEENFHDYVLLWTENEIKVSADGKAYFTFPKQGDWKKWPYFRDFHLILNIAIGGTLGKEVDDSIFPQRMEVEYIRVYQKK